MEPTGTKTIVFEGKTIWTIHLHDDMFQPLIFRGVTFGL